MADTPEVLEPVSLLLASRNFYALIIIFQAFLIFNGEYLYGISVTSAIIYMLLPPAMMLYMLTLTKLDNGKPITWEMLEGSMKGRKDFLSDYLSKAGKKIKYMSLGIQLFYWLFALIFTFTILLFAAMQGWLEVGSLDALQARSAIVYTLVLVAPSETLLFQAIVPLWVALTFAKSDNQIYLIYGLSQIIFASYHYAAYGGSWPSILFAFFLGIIFLFVARTYGIPACIGVHSAWNLVIYGVGQPLIGG